MLEYYIWLQGVVGAGYSKIYPLLEYFGDVEKMFGSSEEELARSRFLTRGMLERAKKLDLKWANKVIEECKGSGINIISLFDEQYPDCLRSIDNPPIVLYVKGKFPDFDNTPSICVVGPREVSEFGKKASFSISARLAKAGMIVVSGGALGSDTYAHLGALKNYGITVMVLGCGINTDYLSENKQLRKRVVSRGCIISEYPPTYPALSFNFPVRNRIMSALSLGTVVTEAGKRSGALITARCANEQGRDVFVIPGNPGDPNYIGSNALIRDGAKLLTDAFDIFSEYILRFPDKINIEKANGKIETGSSEEGGEKPENEKILDVPLSNNAQIVYNQLDSHFRGKEFYPDEIDEGELSTGDILSALTELEIAFVIKAVPGGKYSLL